MAKISNGGTFGLNAQQAQVCRLLVEGKQPEDIIPICFNVLSADGVTADPNKIKAAKARITKWKKLPGFQECYRAILHEVAFDVYGRAIQRIAKQIDDPQGWLANKAANDILTRFSGIVTGEDDKTVTVKIEGMPELGTPDDAEQDVPDA